MLQSSLLQLSIILGLVLASLVSGADYACSDAYQGQCYDCLYNYGICHRQLPSVMYKNGIIYTGGSGNWHLNPVEAMVTTNGQITFLGSTADAELQVQSGTTRVVDLQGRTVLPGFHDVHMHPLEARSKVAGTCLLPPDTAPNDPSLLKVFTQDKCHLNQVGTDWVLGHGHSITALLDYIDQTGKDPKDILDQYVVDANGDPLPAIVMEQTSHSVWVNSEALRLANIGEDIVDSKGSVYMRNNVTNKLNGILLENAGISIMEKAMDPTVYPALRDLAYAGLKDGLYELAKNGITSAVDARSYWKREHHKAWERALADNVLTAKTILSMWAYPQFDDATQIPQLKAFFQNDQTSRLRKSQIKVYMDGLLTTRTARVIGGYIDPYPDMGPVVGNEGINYFTENRLKDYIAALQDFSPDGEGFDFHIHAIGDEGVREALNGIERSQKANNKARHRLTHVELVDPADRPRFAALGVVADAQITGSYTLPGTPGHLDVERLVGHNRGKDSVPVASLLAAGAKVTLSSDWDVSDLNPFISLSNALARGDQSVDLKTALEMKTINSAFVMRQEDRTGSLELNKDADFVVVDQDIFAMEAAGNGANIKNTKVLLTVVEGEEVWRQGI